MTDKQLLASGKRFSELTSFMHHGIAPTTPLQKMLHAYAWANTEQVLEIVIKHWAKLRRAGLLEDAFLDAWELNKYGTPNWEMWFSNFVFSSLDRKRLRELSEPLPPTDPLTVYRGVAGNNDEQRRVLGFSWTLSPEVAKLFADIRVNLFGLPNPAVYRAEIAHEHVLACLTGENHRKEEEVLLWPNKLMRLTCIS